MDILLVLALIWGYNNQPKDVDPITPTGTTFNQAAGFECQSNCTPATSTTIVSAESTATSTSIEAQIIAELEAITESTTVPVTSSGIATSTVSSSTGT